MANANLAGANLTNAFLSSATLTDANLMGAILTSANLYFSTLTHANLTGANLTNANLEHATLTNANLTGADLTNVSLHSSTLTNVDFTRVLVTGADFSFTTSRGFTPEQLYTTRSYPERNLRGINLGGNDLTGWNFACQDLAGATLGENLTNANLTGANLSDASLGPLLANANLAGANLTRARLSYATLTDANLTGANLTGASLHSSTLTNANFTGAVVTGTSFGNTTSRGLTQAQLVSTASYQANDLQGIELVENDLTDWDFSGQNLSSAYLGGSTLTNANLTGANLSSAFLGDAAGFLTAVVTSTTIYNQWTAFPDGFDPVAAGLTLVITPAGDIDASEILDAEDIDMLVTKIRGVSFQMNWLRDAAFDFNEDTVVDQTDHRIWVKDLKHTWFGDANLDGEFNSSDMVQVFVAGKYETGSRLGRLVRRRLERRRHLRQQRHGHSVRRRRVREGTADGCGGGAGAGWVDGYGSRCAAPDVSPAPCAVTNHPISFSHVSIGRISPCPLFRASRQGPQDSFLASRTSVHFRQHQISR